MTSLADGSVESYHTYEPFGWEVPQSNSTSSNSHRFTGHERDRETGLDYMLARYYASNQARFLSVDPISGKASDPQSWNRYDYALNNPLKYLDPDGREELVFTYTTRIDDDSIWGLAGGTKTSLSIRIETDPKISGDQPTLSVEGHAVSSSMMIPGGDGASMWIGTASGDTLKAGATRDPETGNVIVSMEGNESLTMGTGDGAVKVGPGITFSASFVVTPEGTVSGTVEHDAMPTHELVMTDSSGNDTLLYHRPRAKGPLAPLALLPPGRTLLARST
jgi:RHS repeat-associated protein